MHTFLLTSEDWYLVCFGVGLVLSLFSFATGFGHLQIGHFHMPHLHAAHGQGAHLHTHAATRGGMPPFNGFTLLAFLCWFGGTGYLLRHHTGLVGFGVFALSTLSGLVGAGVVFTFLTRVLLPHERELTAEDTDMTGVLARVSSPIREGGTGEIAYSQGGSRRAAAARSDAGLPIGRDVEVVVLRYESGIAYVRAWSELEGPPPA
jgi:membrane protein implicated in regulation of membrane protease activity